MRGPRVLRGRRVLRPRDRRRGRGRAPDGDLDRRWRSRARPVEDGHPPVRAAYRRQALHAGAHDRGLRDLLRHPLPERGAPGRPPAPDLADLPSSRAWARRSGRSRAGSGRTGSRRTGRPATRGSDRADGPASTGRPRSAPRRSRPARRPALFDETSFAKIEIVGPGAVAFLQRPVRQRRGLPVGRIVYTQLLNRRGGIECDLTVTRVTKDRYLIVTGTAFGQHDLGWLRRHLPDDGSVLLNDITSGRVLLRTVGAAGARHPRPRSRATTSPTPASRTSPRAPITHRVRAGLRAARDLRRRARLGAVRPHGVRTGAVADAVGGGTAARPGRRRLSGDRRTAAGEGIPRLVERHHAGRDAVRGGPRLRGRDGQGGRVHRARRAGRGAGGGPRKRLRCLVLDDPR